MTVLQKIFFSFSILQDNILCFAYICFEWKILTHYTFQYIVQLFSDSTLCTTYFPIAKLKTTRAKPRLVGYVNLIQLYFSWTFLEKFLASVLDVLLLALMHYNALSKALYVKYEHHYLWK